MENLDLIGDDNSMNKKIAFNIDEIIAKCKEKDGGELINYICVVMKEKKRKMSLILNKNANILSTQILKNTNANSIESKNINFEKLVPSSIKRQRKIGRNNDENGKEGLTKNRTFNFKNDENNSLLDLLDNSNKENKNNELNKKQREKEENIIYDEKHREKTNILALNYQKRIRKFMIDVRKKY